MSSEEADSERASLLLRQDGSIAKCQDGEVIVQFIKSLRCSIIDPVQYREFLFEVFGPEIVNRCIGTNDGSSGSGVPRTSSPALWNETTVSILMQGLRLFKAEFTSNVDTDGMYAEIATLINTHELEHFYTPAMCQEKVIELTKEYSYQLFKNYVLDQTDTESNFKYFDALHELFGADFPASTVYSRVRRCYMVRSTVLLKEQILEIHEIFAEGMVQNNIQRHVSSCLLQSKENDDDSKPPERRCHLKKKKKNLGPNKIIEHKFQLLRKELKGQNRAILKNQKMNFITQRRIKRAFLQFENLIDEMKNDSSPEPAA